jgi:hypothetical protein
MITENEGNTPAEPTIEELKSKIVRLEQQLSWAEQAKSNKADKLTTAKLLVQTSIDNEEWTDDELSEPFWEELCEILEVELNKEYEIEISATWTATLKGPRGTSIDSMIEDIEIPEPCISWSSTVELDNVRETGSDITER